MKQFIAACVIACGLNISLAAFAEGPDTAKSASKDTAAVTSANPDTAGVAGTGTPEPPKQTVHQSIKRYFVEGGPEFMALVVLALVIGLAVAIERIIYLNLSSSNWSKLVDDVDQALKSGGIEAAKKVCSNTPGPIAGVFYEGLSRADEGIDIVEKTIISYGAVETGKLERGLPWLSLMIALAPMLGFLGTVVGMIQAFDAIALAGDISPNVVAGGIKVALITTVGGLIVAIILQVFYNYILSKIESLVGDMEEASISLVDVLVKNGMKSSR
ncbi:MAG: MotA/TolQ/ExbB proton channel family protein [Flavobacteriales bacterium]|nr:MotA/TolQ/ExbB proton channel family protein [Flavobacteriales bacterium]MCX7767772.1 MotA/TolQ/ExbB proton channel family protein [Flavobacteriales bacterium]MDW8410293.1 MotA/TolQ/ExbB proton channel family protein [Flavobacteriales bacterium]